MFDSSEPILDSNPRAFDLAFGVLAAWLRRRRCISISVGGLP
jgi:hypothetical protein